jgi:hypothetical protein
MYEEVRNKIALETVYLLNTFEEIAFKRFAGPGEKWFAKFKGEREYSIIGSANVVCDAIFESKELTEQEYNNY